MDTYSVVLHLEDGDRVKDTVDAPNQATAMATVLNDYTDLDVTRVEVEKIIDRREAIRQISELTNQARALIRDAEKIADDSGVEFGWDIAYGMGGWYESGEWHASSESC